jgi:AraC-like DNA-binding protein
VTVYQDGDGDQRARPGLAFNPQPALELVRAFPQPDSKITTVAVHLDYSSVSFFSKQFKLATGLAPSEYRRHRLAELAKQSPHKLMNDSLSANLPLSGDDAHARESMCRLRKQTPRYG